MDKKYIIQEIEAARQDLAIAHQYGEIDTSTYYLCIDAIERMARI